MVGQNKKSNAKEITFKKISYDVVLDIKQMCITMN